MPGRRNYKPLHGSFALMGKSVARFVAIHRSLTCRKQRDAESRKMDKREIAAAGTTDINRASSIRTKINVHQDSDTHKTLMKVGEDRAAEQLPRMFGADFEKHIGSTSKIFRTAYYIANEEKPFTDHPKIIDLQEANRNKIGILLRSRITVGSICEFIGREMQKKLARKIMNENA